MAPSYTTDIATERPTVPGYELLDRIGRGAYGDVWLATNTTTGVRRAIKVVLRSRFGEERPFLREFKGIQKFEAISHLHPGHLALFHVGRSDNGNCFFYVMELADDLDELTASADGQAGNREDKETTGGYRYRPYTLRSDSSRGRLPASRVVELGLGLAEALADLHSHGLVHRDIKPSNIVFVAGRPKLADLGLVTDSSDAYSIVGTEGYIAPEGTGTPAADIYALGKVLYECVTGLDRRRYPELPRDAASWGDRDLAFELNEIVLKACHADRSARYRTATELQEDLTRLREGRSVRRRRRWQELARTAGLAVLVGGMIALLLGAGAVLEVMTNRGERASANVTVGSGKSGFELDGLSIPSAPLLYRGPGSVDDTAGPLTRHEIIRQLGQVPILRALELEVSRNSNGKAWDPVHGGDSVNENPKPNLGASSAGLRRSGSNASPDSLAVLSFTSDGLDAEEKYLEDSIADEVSYGLGRVRDLRVAGRSTSRTIQGKRLARSETFSSLGVRYLVEGRIRGTASNLVIRVQVGTALETPIWSAVYSPNRQALPGTLLQISKDVLVALRLVPGELEIRFPERTGTEHPEAWRLFQLGHAQLEKRTDASIARAKDLFKQALALDPEFARAWVGLADSYWFLPFNGYDQTDDSLPIAKSHLERALRLDSSLGEAYASLAHLKANCDWDFDGALDDFERAIELAPNYVRGRYWFGNFLAQMGRGREGLAQVRMAQSLDPLSMGAHFHAMWVLGFLGDYHAIELECRRALEVDPESAIAHGNLAVSLVETGRFDEARPVVRRWLELVLAPASVVASMEFAIRSEGREGYYKELVKFAKAEHAKGRKSWGPSIAGALARLGEHDEAIAWLERSYVGREVTLIEIDAMPDFDTLREDPRFRSIVARIGLPSSKKRPAP